MNKILTLASVIIMTLSGAALNNQTVISETTGSLYDTAVENIIQLKGSETESSPYITDISINIYANGALLHEIIPPVNQGYSPKINLFYFSGNYPQIFYSADSGGSGGYGYYYVYSVSERSYGKIFDAEEYSSEESYSGNFIDGCRMVIKNQNSPDSLTVDVSYMDESFKNSIFNDDCTVKENTTVNINSVSTVFPYYNSSAGRYQLQTYRSVSAIAEVNRLGYIVQYLSLEKGRFVTYMTDFAITIPQQMPYLT